MSSDTLADATVSPTLPATPPATTQPDQRSDRRTPKIAPASIVLFVILAAQLMVVLDATIVNVALVPIKADLHFSSTGLSWVLNAYTLTFGGLLLLGARAGDLLGRRRTFLFGIAIFAIASLAGGFAQQDWFLLTSRALQGVGGALAAPSSLALLTTMFPEGRERLRAIGLFTAVSISGAAIGLIAGGVLTQYASWRWVMFVNVPIGALVWIAGRKVLPETTRKHGEFDLAGALTSVLGMGSLVFGFVNAATDGWGSPVTLAAFISGVVLLTAFVAIEQRAAEPITPLRLLADASRTTANVSRGLMFAGMYGMFFFLSQFLQGPLHYDSLQTGIAFLPMPLTVFAISQVTSKVLVYHVNGKVLMLAGTALAGTGFLLASTLTSHSTYPSIVVCLLLFGAGNGLAFITLTSAALDRVPAADAGAASGLVNVTQQLGGTLGVAVLVTIFGSAVKGHSFAYGADHAFIASALFLLLAFTLVAALVKAPKIGRHTPDPAAATSH